MKLKSPTPEPVYLATTQGGHTFVVKHDEYTFVPPQFRAQALAAGCKFEGQEDDAQPSDDADAKAAAELLATVKALIAKGDPSDFTTGGKVSATRLSAMVGYTVSSEQRDAAWDAASRGE